MRTFLGLCSLQLKTTSAAPYIDSLNLTGKNCLFLVSSGDHDDRPTVLSLPDTSGQI